MPEENGGDVLGDLGARRGVAQNVAPRGRSLVVTARVPLAFDYVAALRSFTRGRGAASMTPSGYEIAPAAVVAEAMR